MSKNIFNMLGISPDDLYDINEEAHKLEEIIFTAINDYASKNKLQNSSVLSALIFSTIKACKIVGLCNDHIASTFENAAKLLRGIDETED